MSQPLTSTPGDSSSGKSRVALLVVMAIAVVALAGFAVYQYRTLHNRGMTITELTDQVAATRTERDAIQRNLGDITATINEVAGKLADARKSQVAINELVSRPAEEITTQRDQMLSDITAIERQLARDGQDIEDLSERIRQSGVKITALENVVASLRKEVAENAKTMANLRAVIEEKDQALRKTEASLRETESSLATVRTELAGTRTELAETQQTLTETRNTAYVAIGTRDDLEKRGIIDVSGMIRKSVGLADEIDESLFTRIDITSERQFALSCRPKDVKLVAERPQSSYTIEEAGKKQSVLKVTQPDQFWRLRYLAVIVKD